MTTGKRQHLESRIKAREECSANVGINFHPSDGLNANTVKDITPDAVLRRNSVTMENIKKELENEKIEQCQTCGGPVVIKGKTTKYFVPVDVNILKEMGFKF